MKLFKIISTILLAVCLSGCAASQNTTNLKNAISMAETSQGKIFILYPDFRISPGPFRIEEYADIYHNSSFSGTLNIGEAIALNASKGMNDISFSALNEKLSFSKKPNLKVHSNQNNNIYIIITFDNAGRTIEFLTGASSGNNSKFKVISKDEWIKNANLSAKRNSY